MTLLSVEDPSDPANLVQIGAEAQANIPINATHSAAINIKNMGPRGLSLEIPVGWTAADIGFEVAGPSTPTGSEPDPAAWSPLYDDTGSPVVLTSISEIEKRVYIAPPAVWAVGGYDNLRLHSVAIGDYSTSVVQLAAINILVKALS